MMRELKRLLAASVVALSSVAMAQTNLQTHYYFGRHIYSDYEGGAWGVAHIGAFVCGSGATHSFLPTLPLGGTTLGTYTPNLLVTSLLVASR